MVRMALIIAISLIASASFAECNNDSNLRLINFPPSNLAAYLPMDSLIEQNIYNNHNDYIVRYNLVYKGKPITLFSGSTYSSDLAFFKSFQYETVKLKNINNTAELKKWECNDKICSYAIFSSDDISGEGYNTTISYTLPMNEVHIGEKFMKSLFINDYKCTATEPDSIINHGPFKIDIKFDSNSATVLPQYYANIANFAKFINDNDVNVNIEGHTDKTEVLIDSEVRKYNLELSKKRAEAVKDLLVEAYGVDLAKIKETTAESYQRPLASNDTEEGRQMNRRVQAYIY